MTQPTIYRTEPMATRALAAEIRQDPQRFLQFLEDSAGKSFGPFEGVACEVKLPVAEIPHLTVRIDVLLTFTNRRVGIEAKLDHELTRTQIDNQIMALGSDAIIFVLLPSLDHVPVWMTDYPDVIVIAWEQTIGCFDDPRITMEDIHGEGRLLKSTVESWLTALRMNDRLPMGWDATVKRGNSGMPSVVIESPPLPNGQTLRGQIEVYGRGMRGSLDEVRFISHIGISVEESPENYFDPAVSELVPMWITHLRMLHDRVLKDNEKRLRISLSAPGTSTRELGQWKKALAKRHLGADLAYLAKGYTDGWALGVKTENVSREDLNDLANITVEIFTSWYEVEWSAI